MANGRLYEHWSHLPEALRTGLLQNEARGGDETPFAALYADGEPAAHGFPGAKTLLLRQRLRDMALPQRYFRDRAGTQRRHRAGVRLASG
jgi:hypothetical protein